MFFTASDQFQIRYEKQSWSSAQNVLFIHGNLACLEWWAPTIKQLQNLQLRDLTESSKNASEPSKNTNDSSQKIADSAEIMGSLVCADWRGYGQSKGLTSPAEIDFNRYALDLVELLRSLELTDVHLVGHSTGGLIAMMAALQAPELFKSLVLLDSVGLKGLELDSPLEQVLQGFDQLQQDEKFCRMVLASTIKGMSETAPDFEALFQITRQCDPICWRGVPEVLATQIDLTRRIDQMTLSTLILHGEADQVLPVEGSTKLASQIAHSELKIIKDHGHSLNLEDPKLFASKLVRFWQGLVQ